MQNHYKEMSNGDGAENMRMRKKNIIKESKVNNKETLNIWKKKYVNNYEETQATPKTSQMTTTWPRLQLQS